MNKLAERKEVGVNRGNLRNLPLSGQWPTVPYRQYWAMKSYCHFISFFIFKFIYCIYLCLAALGLHCCTRAVSSCGKWGLLLRYTGFSLWWLLLLRSTGSRHTGFGSCGSRALECRLSSCGAGASLLRGLWDLPRPGLEPMSPALAGGFLTTAPPGKPCHFNKSKPVEYWLFHMVQLKHFGVWQTFLCLREKLMWLFLRKKISLEHIFGILFGHWHWWLTCVASFLWTLHTTWFVSFQTHETCELGNFYSYFI